MAYRKPGLGEFKKVDQTLEEMSQTLRSIDTMLDTLEAVDTKLVRVSVG